MTIIFSNIIDYFIIQYYSSKMKKGTRYFDERLIKLIFIP